MYIKHMINFLTAPKYQSRNKIYKFMETSENL